MAKRRLAVIGLGMAVTPHAKSFLDLKDRLEIANQVARIAVLMRDALPHRASKVSKIELYYGNKLVRVIPLAKMAE